VNDISKEIGFQGCVYYYELESNWSLLLYKKKKKKNGNTFASPGIMGGPYSYTIGISITYYNSGPKNEIMLQFACL